MKKLHIKAFWLILSGLAASFISLIIGFFTLGSIDYSVQLDPLGLTAEQLELVENAVFGIYVFIVVIVSLIYAYFVYRLIKNKDAEAPQGYITFLYVISIIGAFFNVISLLGADYTALLSLCVQGVIIAGCTIQRKYIPENDPPQDNNFFN